MRSAPAGIRNVEVGAVGKAHLNTSTGDTNKSRGKAQERRYSTKDHSEYRTVEAVVKAKKVRSTAKIATSSRGNTRGEIGLPMASHENLESNARRLDKNRENIARRHYLKAMLLKVFRALASVTEIARLQTVKADRHHQYCSTHRIWINLAHHVACSRARRTEQVSKGGT